ncbi:SGNH hydrolase [Wilcoxina mikolae CBS 423.85]|nr:SGNH hydrolase [Wilcoxina mikolae CBS 423.85]
MAPNLGILVFIALCTAFAVHLLQLNTGREIQTTAADLSWIESYAALGDSYGVGIGAGHPIKGSSNVPCWQYSHGYPNQLNSLFSRLETNPSRKFQFLGCSGALIIDVLSKQVPLLDRPQVVTVSAGGNDADLSTILNYCIYQWAAYDSWTCERVLAESRNKTESVEFAKNIDDLLVGIKERLRDEDSRIYYTGYSKFWDATDTACDNVTWSFTRLSGYQYLTQDRRRTMNDLVDLVNRQIKDAVSRAGPKAVFIDWQQDVDRIQGRYCEPGVDESYNYGKGPGINRESTSFYEWGTTKDDADDDVDSPKEWGYHELRKRWETPTNATFEGAITNWVNRGLQNHTEEIASSMPGSDFSGRWLPDKYARVFHPTKLAHGIIADSVLKAMVLEQRKYSPRGKH